MMTSEGGGADGSRVDGRLVWCGRVVLSRNTWVSMKKTAANKRDGQCDCIWQMVASVGKV